MRTNICQILIYTMVVIVVAVLATLGMLELLKKCEVELPQYKTDSPSLVPTFSPAPGNPSNNPPLLFLPIASEPLTLCQGDCDTDADCAGDLICHQREAFEAVPGCSGGLQDGSRTDYCVHGPQVEISLPFGSGQLERPLELCEGDCDSDADCALDYVCHQRDVFGAVPGCRGGEENDSKSDFCVDTKYRCDPSDDQDIPFNGIKIALSYEVGKLELWWNAADSGNSNVAIDTNVCDGSLEYVVFLAEGSYSFDGLSTVEDFFNADGLASVTTSELHTVLSGLNSDALYTAIVLARLGESWISSNREGTEIRISNENPKLENGVNLVNLLEQDEVVVETLSNSSARISGPGWLSLELGDWVNGVDSQGEPFLFRLESQVMQEATSAVWSVQDGTFMDIYEDLTVEAVVDVTEDLSVEDTAPATRHRHLRSPNLEESRSLKDFKRKFTFERKFQVGPASLNFKVENTYEVRLRIEKKFSIFNPKLDVKASIARTASEELKAVFNSDESNCSLDDIKVGNLVSGFFRKEVSGKVVRFPIGPALYLTVQPKFEATFAGNVTLCAVLEASNSFSEKQVTEYRYSLDNGWEDPVRTGDAPSRTGPNFDLSGQIGVHGSMSVAPSLEVSVNNFVYLEGIVLAGISLAAEVSTNPPPLLSLNNPLHISKLECIVKASLGLNASLTEKLALIPGISEDDIKKSYSKDIAREEVFSMPKPEFVSTGHGGCDGEKAYSLYFELGGEPGKIDTGFTERNNNLISPYNIVNDFSAGSDWVLEYSGGKKAEIYVARSGKRDASGAWAVPDRFFIYGQGHISAFSTPFFAVLHKEVDILNISGAPAIHECCDDEDCSSMFGAASTCFMGSCENKEQNGNGSIGNGANGNVGVTPPPSNPPVQSTRVHSDPHFLGWRYSLSYQGECDLVYVSTKDITIHVRTKLSPNRQFSFVQAVVVSISGERLEIQNDAGAMSYFIDGSARVNPPSTFAGYSFFVVGSQFVIELGRGQSIRFRQRRGMIAVDVTGNDATFGESMGISGSFRQPVGILRNSTLVENTSPEVAEKIALNWVVDESKGDEILFMTPSPHQGCLLPDPLDFTTAEWERAASLCSFVEADPVAFDNCIFDVLGTGDDSIIDEYTEPLLTVPTCSNPNKCMASTLDETSGVCQYTAIPCMNAGENCDPIDGQCKSADNLVPAIAVIDETHQQQTATRLRNDWLEFRRRFPSRPFVVLQPKPDPSHGNLYLPPEFLDDPLTRYYQDINRDGRDGGPIEDWFALAGVGQWSDVKYVGLFVDDSGSLRVAHVAGSLAAFEANCTARGIEVRQVYNADENPFRPFMTTLVR